MVHFKPLSEAYWNWVKCHLRIYRVEDSQGLIAVDDDGELLAAVVFDSQTATSVQAHFLLLDKMVIRHGWLDLVHDFAWDHLGANVIYGLVPGDNEKALKLNSHMGFTVSARLKEAYAPGVDYVLMELRKENSRHGRQITGQRCRRGRDKVGKVQPPASAGGSTGESTEPVHAVRVDRVDPLPDAAGL